MSLGTSTNDFLSADTRTNAMIARIGPTINTPATSITIKSICDSIELVGQASGRTIAVHKVLTRGIVAQETSSEPTVCQLFARDKSSSSIIEPGFGFCSNA